MAARLAAVSVYLPDATLTNADLAEQFPEWSVEKIASKTGINTRHIAGPDQYSSHLGTAAGRALFSEHGVNPDSIDYLLVCTQSPDYFLPSTALLIHAALGLRTDTGATDITLGCSGYIYAVGLAKGLLETQQATNVLVVTTDTYTRFINSADKSVRTLFGDAATATLVTNDGSDRKSVV